MSGYLLNTMKPQGKAHLWDGNDTACRMWSTGGLRQTRPGWEVHDTAERRIVCHMCLQNTGQAEQGTPGP